MRDQNVLFRGVKRFLHFFHRRAHAGPCTAQRFIAQHFAHLGVFKVRQRENLYVADLDRRKRVFKLRDDMDAVPRKQAFAHRNAVRAVVVAGNDDGGDAPFAQRIDELVE